LSPMLGSETPPGSMGRTPDPIRARRLVVHWQNPINFNEASQSTLPRQHPARLLLATVDYVYAAVRSHHPRSRDPGWQTSDSGTRLAVEFILELLAVGQSEGEILAEYPGLSREDIVACLSYASYLAHEYKAFPIPA
jgi:hypothetical protein